MPPASARRGALLVFVLLGALHAWRAGDAGVGIDFYQFWAVGQAVRGDLVENVYAPEAWPRLARIFLERAGRDGGRRHVAAAEFRRDEIQTSNTPFLYASFHAFESGDYEKDIKRFRALSLAAVAASVLAIAWLAGLGVEGGLVALAIALWAFAPLHYDLGEGNVNALQLGCLVLALVLARGSARWCLPAAGAVLGVGVAFKPNLVFVPIAVALAWSLRRRWRDVASFITGAALGGAAAVAAGAIFFGPVTIWLDWAGTLSRIQETFGSEVKWGSFGGARLLLDFTGWNLSALLYMGCFAALALAVVQGKREGSGSRGRDRREDLLVFGLGPMIPILSADLAWPHYLVQAIPLAIALLASAGPALTMRSGRVPAGAGGAAALVEPGLALAGLAGIASPPFVEWIAPRSDYAYAVPLAAGALLLFIAGCLALARSGQPAASPSS